LAPGTLRQRSRPGGVRRYPDLPEKPPCSAEGFAAKRRSA
jgi:hypothetical protein